MSEMLITADQLKQAMGREPWLIFDVRHDLGDHQAGHRAYLESHIPGALYLDHETQLSAPRTGNNGRHPLPALEDFAALMRSLGLTPASRVAIYDASGGMFSAHLWWMLRWIGHTQVAVLDGGWPAWVASGGPSETGAGSESDHLSATAGEQTQAISGKKTPDETPKQGMPTVDAAAVLANIHQPVFTVLDARAPERFRGEVEPMDPVAGHIPGALNRPNSLNLQADGRFKPAQQLQDEFSALLEGRVAEEIVHQCGSGITASHNLFAMELAGLHGSSLYPGSWSEWCSDPKRPIAQGE